MSNNDRDLVPYPRSSTVDHITKPNSRLTRAFLRSKSITTTTNLVGTVRRVLGKCEPFPGFDEDYDGSLDGWVWSTEVVFSRDGTMLLSFPEVFSVKDDYQQNSLTENSDYREIELLMIGAFGVESESMANGWIFGGTDDLSWGNRGTGYRSDLWWIDPRFAQLPILVHQFLGPAYSATISCLAQLGDRVVAFCSDRRYLIIHPDLGVTTGTTTQHFSAAAQAGDSVYCISSIGSRTVDRLKVENLLQATAPLISEPVSPIASYHVEYPIYDMAGTGDILILLERTNVVDWNLHNGPSRIAAYGDGSFLGSFVPAVNGIPVACSAVAATDDLIALSVDVDQGGIVLFENGSQHDWQRLPVSEQTSSSTTTIQSIIASWDSIRLAIKGRNAKIEALLRECEPLKLQGSTLTIGVPYRFHLDRLREPQHIALLEQAIGEHVGVVLNIDVTLQS